MTDADSTAIGEAAAQYVAYLSGEVPTPPDLGALEPGLQPRARQVLAALDAVWHADVDAPPPLAQDPTAIALGLVPDPGRALSSAALRAARQRHNLSVSDLAERLRQRGWDTKTADVYTWEQKPSAAGTVPPAVIAALADELRITEGSLVAAAPTLRADVEAVSSTPSFRALARRWSAAMGLGGEAQGAAGLQQLMLAGAVRRGAELAPQEWLTALEALVRSREDAGRTP